MSTVSMNALITLLSYCVSFSCYRYLSCSESAHIALIRSPLLTCCGCLIRRAGEVFVLDDGGEVDLDLGNYERFLDIRLTKENNLTTGKIYQSVINKERKGDYLGKTVQGESACS